MMSKDEYLETLKTEWKKGTFYRDLWAEFTATFLLMAAQCALYGSWDREDMGSVIQVSLGMAAIVGAGTWSMGDFGGAYMNPAISVSMMLLTKITFVRGIIYIGVQCLAGMTGAAFINAVTPYNQSTTLGATVLHPDLQPWQGFLTEMWLTFILVLTIHGSTNVTRKGDIYMPSLFVAMAVNLGLSCGFYATGGSMNPARSLGPAVVRGVWDNHWIYWIGPLVGSTLATFIYHIAFDFVDNPRRLHSSLYENNRDHKHDIKPYARRYSLW